MTTVYQSLSHSKWKCNYHVVFVPKCRKKELYGQIREYLKAIFHELAQQKGCEIVGEHVVQDHIHMIISIPPKNVVSGIVGYLKGKARSRLLDNLVVVKAILIGSTFGQEVVLFQQLVLSLTV